MDDSSPPPSSPFTEGHSADWGGGFSWVGDRGGEEKEESGKQGQEGEDGEEEAEGRHEHSATYMPKFPVALPFVDPSEVRERERERGERERREEGKENGKEDKER